MYTDWNILKHQSVRSAQSNSALDPDPLDPQDFGFLDPDPHLQKYAFPRIRIQGATNQQKTATKKKFLLSNPKFELLKKREIIEIIDPKHWPPLYISVFFF